MKINDVLNRISTSRAMIIGILLAAFYYFIVFDKGVTQTAQIEQNTAKIASLQDSIKQSQAKLDRAMVYKKTATEIGSTITKLLTLIPEKFAMPDLMRIVSNEAKVAGSSLADIKPATTQVSPVAKEFEEISVTIELNGSFLQHMVFLSNLTKIPQILIIRKFDFALIKEGRGDEPSAVKMNAEIVAFRYRGAAAQQTKEPGK